jgi:flagellar capping protein FliD
MPTNSLKGKLVREYLLAYPTTPTQTIAKMLVNDNPKVYNSVEDARSTIRYYRNEINEASKKPISFAFAVIDDNGGYEFRNLRIIDSKVR